MNSVKNVTSGTGANPVSGENQEGFQALQAAPGTEILKARLGANDFLECSQTELGLPGKIHNFLSVKYFNVVPGNGQTSFRS